MEYFAQTLAAKGKIKNGDCYLSYEDDAVFVGCVADGVGGAPCDWKASKEICEDFIYYFNEYRKEKETEESARYSLRKSFAKLSDTQGECRGMLSALVSVIIDKPGRQFFYFSVGDCKVLLFEEGTITEISRETDFRTEPDIMMNYVQGSTCSPNTSFVLLTDGFWANRKSYALELEVALNSEEWKDKIAQLFAINALTRFDDLTMMVIRV